MVKWQDSAKQIILNRNASNNSSSSNNETTGTKSSGSWQQQAKQILDNRGYIPPEKREYEIKLDNGKNFGTVSYGAYKAIQNNTIDKYTPKNDDEKNTIDSFNAYIKEQEKKQEEKEKQKRINSNPVTKKYGIDPDNFTKVDFEKWAEDHGFEYRMGGNDLTGAQMEWQPKQKGGWKFWEVVPSKEEQSDKDVLEALAENNARKASSKTDVGAQDEEKTNNKHKIASTSAKKDGFFSWLGKQTMAGLGQFNKSITATLDFILPTEFLGRYDFISSMNDYYTNANNYYSQEAAKSSASKGKGWNIAGDVVAGTVAALPNAILAYMSAGASLGAQGASTGLQAGSVATTTVTGSTAKQMLGNAVKAVAKNPMYWSSFLQTVGNDYEDAKANGANEFVASSTAILTSLLNAGVEVSGGIETLPTSVKQGGKKAVLNWVKSSIDEGKEEVIQGIVTNSIAKMTYDSNRQVINPKESLKEFALGTAVGGILGGGQTAFGTVARNATFRNTGKNYNDGETVKALIDEGLQSPEGTESREIAEQLNKKLLNGKRISNTELGQLVYANEAQISREQSTNEFTDERTHNKIESTIETNQTPVPLSTPTTTPDKSSADVGDVADDTAMESTPVSVGDTFHDTKTGTTLTVISRDANNTVVRVNESGIKKTYTNDVADMMSANPTFEKVDSTTDTEAPQNTESADTLSPEDAQKYNIVVSNLKRKAEELGLLDTNFFNTLQNANLYNPSESDRALISTEFRRVFAGNTDPLVADWLNAIDVEAQPVTSINEQNMPVSTENTPANEDVTNIDVDMAEGEILSLKHTKNVYSLFKGAMRVVVGKDIITDGFVVLPLTNESLEGVKKVLGDSAPIQENPNFEMSKFYHADNDVIIQGNPKVSEATAGNKTVKAYTFKIADAFYSCQQKFIDAFNNGKNVIKANKSINIPWTVHNENGELVALFLGLRANATEQSYNQMQSVAEIKSAEQQKKADNAAKPFNQNEIRLLFKDARPNFLNANGSTYVGNNSLYAVCDTEAVEFLKTEYRNRNTNSNYEIEFSDSFGSRVEKLLSDAVTIAETGKSISHNIGDKDFSAYVIGDYAIAFDKNYANFVKKHSATTKIVSEGNLATTLLVGYDTDGNVTAFALPILAQGEVTAKDGAKYPFATSNSIKKTVKETKDSVTKKPETVIETPESVTNSEKTEENTPVAEEKTEYKHLYNKETVSEDFINSVNPEIESAILNIRNGNIEAVPNVVEVTELTEEAVKKISDFVGYDISGYACKIERDRLVHIENRHGMNGEHDQSLSDPKDTARMGYVVNNSDRIEWAADEKGNKVYDSKYNDRHNKIAPVLVMEKRIDGTYSISQVVPDSNRKTLWITSARIEKAAVGSQVPNADNSPQLTPETPLNSSSASNTIIAEGTQNVNPSKEIATPTLTDKCELHETTHTKTGEALWVISLNDKISSDEYKALSAAVKKVGGYYSRFAKTPDGKAIPGFVFKTEPTEKEIKVFNDFFGYTEETTPVDTQTVDVNEKVYELVKKARNAEPVDAKSLEEIRDYYGYDLYKEALDRVIAENKADELIGKAKELKTLMEENSTPDDVLNNRSESAIIEENTDKDGVKNVESQSEVLDRESKSNGRGLHAGAENKTKQGGVESTDGTYREDSGKGLSESVRTDGNRPDDRNDSEGVYGTDDADNAESEVRGNSAEITDSEPETIDTEVKTIEKKRPSNKGNFVITDDIAAEFDNTAPSARDNIEAIELLLKLENEGRPATAEEKKILAKYKGWGGIDPRYIPYELSSRFGQLFDWEQRKAMQSSSNNAFFTPTGVIDAMYNGLKRIGFKGGNVLETSMGVGNFFGRMPSAISAKSALTGVELESYTARIAQYLYPGATVINKPFQDVAIKNGSYDLVIGNVPFGTNKISYNKKKYSLHNYFIISSLDKVRDGGIVAVITSAGTLDSHSIDARAAIMDRADVVACYKLPEKVFSRNASTDVQSDLLILRKRSADEKPKGDSILNTITTAHGFRINEYFDKHPENVLGTLAKGHNAWGEITTVLNDGNFYDKLNAAMKKLPKDLISGKVDLKPIETIVSLSDKPRLFEKNGKVYADDGAGTATEVSRNQANTVRDYIAVRDAYKELLNAYENGETAINADGTATIREMSDEDIKPLRDALSKAYDNFYKKHGAITGDGKKKIGTKKSTNNTFLEADADYYLVGGLERYDAKNSTFVKSALFEKDTLRKKRVTSVDVASDALAVSLNESGRIDFARMQELTGKTEKQLAEELKGEIVLTPDGEYVLTDIYLSGNIYEKLDAVKGKPEFKAQQEMLEKVIPTPKDASEITVKLGANYIDTEYIEQFAREILSTNLTIRKDVSGRWLIEGVKQSRYGDIVNVKYGCAAFNGVQLLEKILNDGEITATKKVGTGRDAVNVFDPEMTDIARQKADDIRDAFETWIFANTDRRTKIVDNYNRTYNNYRPLDYERIAEKLSFDSMDETLKAKLYPHQKKGIARFLFGGNILFAHGVGTGKTFEMIASVMEAKRMGIINKAAMVVPNNKVVDFKNDIAQAYPNAKVLVIDTANKKRQTMLGLVNSNDWDIVLIARTTFTKIPISPEFQTHYIAQQLEDLELQIAEAENDRSVSKRQLKGMITQRDNLEQKIKDLDAETKRDTNSVDFEKLGIDCICVDEAHNYKSIMTPTKLDIKGLVNRNNAQMANDMLMKLDYLRSIDGKIIFGTGTPITNTVSEIYNMMRMVRPDILEDAGIHSLDEWVNTFAKIETTTEIGIDNQIKNKSTQVIRSFINVSEMIGMFRQFADIVFTTDVVKNLPKAVYKDVELEGTDEHRQIEQQISSVISTAKKADLLKVYGQLMSMADVASVDLRMLAGAESEYNPFKDYSLDELEYSDSKINTMCDNVYEEYKASEKIKGTQIIFCDKGSGSGTVYSFNLHKDIMQKLNAYLRQFAETSKAEVAKRKYKGNR